MEAIGLLVTLEARQGKAADAEAFLKSAQALALDEKGTLKWYAIKLGPGKFGIFDTFANEGGRNAHLTGEIAKALGARANELLAVPPQIEKVEVLASTPLAPAYTRTPWHHSRKQELAEKGMASESSSPRFGFSGACVTSVILA
jgi:quinol monooxygenase YgiN